MTSKYGNSIYLSDSDKIIRKKIEEAITDPARKTLKDKGHPDICTIFKFHQIYNQKNVKDVEVRCKKARIGCRECKKNLANILIDTLSDLRKKRKELLQNAKIINKTLEAGRKKASKIAKQTLEEVKRVVGI